MLIACPKCGQTIPSSVDRCQFCGETIPANLKLRPDESVYHDEDALQIGSGLPDEKVWKIYNGLCWFLVGLAAWNVLGHFVLRPLLERESAFGANEVVLIVFVLVQAAFGYALLQRVEWVRNVATFVMLAGTVVALLKLIGYLLSITMFGLLGVLFVILGLVELAIWGGMFWAIGETERLIERDRMLARSRPR